MVIKLDKYDKKLLYQLDINARQSYVQLAKKIGLSKDTIKYRINNYLKTGTLDGFYALIDASKLGYYSIRAYFKFKNTTSKKEKEIIHYLINQREVWYLGRAEGSCDIFFGFWTREIINFNKFWKNFKIKFGKRTTKEKHGLFLELDHFSRNYLQKTNNFQTIKGIAEPKLEKIDKTDEKILELLSKDARIQIAHICKKVNLTAKAVILRIKNLEKKKIILGYKAKLNLEKIGYSMYKIDLMLSNPQKINEVRTYLFRLPNIIHSEIVLGGSDFEFDLECKGFEEFNCIISKVKENIGEDIESLDYYRTLKIYKAVYLPILGSTGIEKIY